MGTSRYVSESNNLKFSYYIQIERLYKQDVSFNM